MGVSSCMNAEGGGYRVLRHPFTQHEQWFKKMYLVASHISEEACVRFLLLQVGGCCIIRETTLVGGNWLRPN